MLSSISQSHIIHIIISFLLKFITLNSTNTYLYNDTFWQSTSPFVPTFNTSYANIILHKSLKMDFDFIYFGPVSSNEWAHIFRIGNGHTTDCSGRGSQFPAIFIHHTEVDRLYIGISETGNNGCWASAEIDVALEIHKKYHVHIQYNETWQYINFNYGEYEIVKNNTISQDFLYQSLSIWISDEFEDPPNITLSNIIISTWDPITPQPTNPPTILTPSPSIPPSAATTIVPTDNPTSAPSETPDTFPTAWLSISTTDPENEVFSDFVFVLFSFRFCFSETIKILDSHSIDNGD